MNKTGDGDTIQKVIFTTLNIGKRLKKKTGLYNTFLDLLSIENSKLNCQIKPNEYNTH